MKIGEAPDQWIYLSKAASTSGKKRSPGRLFRREKEGVCLLQNYWQENFKRISSRNEKQMLSVVLRYAKCGASSNTTVQKPELKSLLTLTFT